jgi:hypothetical protein
MLSGRFFESSKNKMEVLIPTIENELPENYKGFQEKIDNLIYEEDENENDIKTETEVENYFRK